MSTLTLIGVLVLFPLLIALILLFIRSDAVRGPVVIIGAAGIATFSVWLTIANFGKDASLLWETSSNEISEIVSKCMMGIEVVLAILIIVLGIKYRKYLASILAFLQTGLFVWYELTHHEKFEVSSNISLDSFGIIMVLIIGIIGTLICVYSLGYMKDFAHHHAEQKDRRPFFFFLMFVFLSAMFGIVLSNNLVFMYFFWEITTLCSFFLIGYTKTPEAIKNSFKALIYNLIGGLAFCVGIVLCAEAFEYVDFNSFISENLAEMATTGSLNPPALIIVTLLAFAGLTKAAQMPFSSWLLGAMVAPTPTSALLHSSTMVKAGVFMIIKLSPLLGAGSIVSIGPGFMVVMVGGGTFLLASMAAVSQSNAKRVLAYSTIANLGLICACAGLGSAEGAWAAVMLVIFHAVTKSLLFLSVGTAEHNIGSRDIEDMDGLFGRMPRLATFMIVGIAAMFLAPFGMLISKWAALKSFVDDGNFWVILFICFGSAVTVFYWGKWIGKLTAIVAKRENIQNKVHNSEWFSLGAHIVLVLGVSLTFPLISDKFVLPFVGGVYQGGMTVEDQLALSGDNMLIMVVMVAIVLILPLLFYGRTSKRIVPLYMSGVGEDDNLTYHGSMGKDVSVTLRNWYMEGIFGEKKMNRIGIIYSCLILAMSFAYASSLIVYVLSMLGGAAGGAA